VYTGIEELKGFEEKFGKVRFSRYLQSVKRLNCRQTRPFGVDHGENAQRRSWKEKRVDKSEFVNEDPTVLVVGVGQAGLTIGARLGQLNVPTLIVEYEIFPMGFA